MLLYIVPTKNMNVKDNDNSNKTRFWNKYDEK